MSCLYTPSWLTLSNLLSVLTLVVLIFATLAAFRQARAANRQADAADKLIEATKEQINASQEQADAAKKQQEMTRRQLVESLRPLLLLEGEGGGSTHFDTQLVNDGVGPALDIKWFYGKLPNKDQQPFYRTILGSKQRIGFRYLSQQGKATGITLTYKSLTGSLNATQIEWNKDGMRMDYLQDLDPSNV